jgi:hypothetical protein
MEFFWSHIDGNSRNRSVVWIILPFCSKMRTATPGAGVDAPVPLACRENPSLNPR